MRKIIIILSLICFSSIAVFAQDPGNNSPANNADQVINDVNTPVLNSLDMQNSTPENVDTQNKPEIELKGPEIQGTQKTAAPILPPPVTTQSTQKPPFPPPILNQPSSPKSTTDQLPKGPCEQQSNIPGQKQVPDQSRTNQVAPFSPGQQKSPTELQLRNAVPQKGGTTRLQVPALPGQMPVPAAQTPSLNALSPSAIPAPIPPQTSAATSRVSVSHGQISLNFDDADIYSVIQTVFGEIQKSNYIIDPKVKGRVTFRSVAPVPVENVLPLMEVILRLNGVAIVEENSLYRIIPISDLAREPSAISIGRKAEKVEVRGKALLQVVPIEYLPSSEIVKLMTPFVSTSAVIVDVPKTNHIIIVDTDSNIKRLLQLINIFDSEQQKRKGPQVYVYHVQNSKAKDISTLLQQIFLGAKAQDKNTASASATKSGQTNSAAPAFVSSSMPQQTGSSSGTETLVSDLVKIFADEILNAIIILGTPEDYQIIKETIVKLDIVPRQVLIEGAIAQISLTDKMSLGLAWSLKTNLFNLNAVTIALNPSQLSSDTSSTSGLSLVGIDSGNSVRAVINALASNSKAKLLASPHIMVSDNREARIQVGQQVPIPTSETYGGTVGGAVPIRTIQYKDIGIILKVKPQINDSGLVAMEISQEVSTYVKDTLYAGETQIILNKTEASTNLVVQDGQTIVIGGLIREDDSKARQGIPFLSKIPILGYLFGNTDNENLRTELVILLTPHVVKTQKDVSEVTHKYIDKMTDKEMSDEVKKGIQIKAEEPKKEVPKDGDLKKDKVGSE
jgi:type II secretory pathway component GspD/PulD (secretin)